jgi:hypothetical protein
MFVTFSEYINFTTLWGISANVDTIFGLFATHFFTNSNKGDEDLGSNANKEAVHKAQLENRERCKAASQAKKDKDKEDREKQKKDGEDRKKKAQDKSAKVERKR